MKRVLHWICLVLLALLAVFGGAGCKSTEPDNLSSRPWNSPRGWEHGLPSALNEGR